MKTTKEMIEVMQAYADGEKIEAKPKDGYWYQTDQPVWDWTRTDYRIAVTQDSIDWTHVHKDFNFHVRERSGSRYLSQYRPKACGGGHWSGGGKTYQADILSSFVEGTCDWKNSLVERPL